MENMKASKPLVKKEGSKEEKKLVSKEYGLNRFQNGNLLWIKSLLNGTVLNSK